MILKIKIGKGTNWRVVDDVKSIHYEYIDEVEALARKDLNGESGIPCTKINNYGALKDKRVCEVIVNYINKAWEVIYTDDTIYVLNNEGKTCESVGVYN